MLVEFTYRSIPRFIRAESVCLIVPPPSGEGAMLYICDCRDESVVSVDQSVPEVLARLRAAESPADNVAELRKVAEMVEDWIDTPMSVKEFEQKYGNSAHPDKTLRNAARRALGRGE